MALETLIRETDTIQDQELEYLAKVILANRGVEVGDDSRSYRTIAKDLGYLTVDHELAT